MIERTVLFGASGDLTSRLLLPAVAQLAEAVFIRGDEAEEAWRIIDPVMAAWASGDVPKQECAAGKVAPGPAL